MIMVRNDVYLEGIVLALKYHIEECEKIRQQFEALFGEEISAETLRNIGQRLKSICTPFELLTWEIMDWYYDVRNSECDDQ